MDAPLAVDWVLAGPGVAQTAGGVDALRRFAATTGIGVLNTSGLKGLFRWDDPAHLGTAGLQERDFVLAGLGPDSTVLAVGVDPDECPAAALAAAGTSRAALVEGQSPFVVIAVDALDDAAARCVARTPGAGRPALFTELAAHLQRLYASDASPIAPPRLAADLAAWLPAGALAVADAGPVGFWVARTFPTTELGSVRVPARRQAGFAASTALDAGCQGRPAIALTAGPLDAETKAVLATARADGVPLVLEVWGAEGIATPADHRAALDAAVAAGGVQVLPVAVDFGLLAGIEAVAGPLVAWT